MGGGWEGRWGVGGRKSEKSWLMSLLLYEHINTFCVWFICFQSFSRNDHGGQVEHLALGGDFSAAKTAEDWWVWGKNEEPNCFARVPPIRGSVRKRIRIPQVGPSLTAMFEEETIFVPASRLSSTGSAMSRSTADLTSHADSAAALFPSLVAVDIPPSAPNQEGSGLSPVPPTQKTAGRPCLFNRGWLPCTKIRICFRRASWGSRTGRTAWHPPARPSCRALGEWCWGTATRWPSAE